MAHGCVVWLKGEEFDDVQNEIAMLEQCHHGNIVSYFGSFIKNKTMWICMEFCGGKTHTHYQH